MTYQRNSPPTYRQRPSRRQQPRQQQPRQQLSYQQQPHRQYQRQGSRYTKQQPKGQRPPWAIPVAIVLIALIVAAMIFAVWGFSGGHEGSNVQTGTDAPASTQAASYTQAPEGRIVMTLGGDVDTQVLVGEDYLEAGCHALDKSEGDITSSVETEGAVDTSTPGDYTVTYTATNSENMQATKTRNVHVVSKMDADKDGISVMMYHYVYADDDPPDTDDTNYLSQSKLRAQLQWLNKNDYYFPSYQELRAYVDGTHSLPKKSVVLTFDDAQSGFLKYGIPVLEECQVPATSFVICDRKGAKKNIKKYASEYVTFQSHSYTLHNDGNTNIGRGGHIYDLNQEELVEDLEKAQKFLGTTEAFAYPYGDVSDVAPAAMDEAGILCAFTINYDQVHKGDDHTQLSRIRVFGEGSLDSFAYQVKKGKG